MRGTRARSRGAMERSRAVAPTTGPLPLLARRRAGGLRGARDRWLARLLVDLDRRRRPLPRRARALAGAGSREGRGVDDERRRRGPRGLGRAASRAMHSRAHRGSTTCSTSSSSTREKDDYEALFSLARERVEPGGLVVADNVLSHVETLGAYSAARQSDPTLSSVTVPLDRGLELTTILTSGLTAPLSLDHHGKEVVRSWKPTERAVEVLARRGVSPETHGESPKPA